VATLRHSKPAHSTFVDRIVRTAKLNAAAYEEVEADSSATGQALGVVVLSSLAAAMATGPSIGGLIVGILVSLAAWYVWAFLTYWIGTRLLPEPQTRSSHGELLRVLGFASGPGMIRVVGAIPALRGLAFLVAAVWMLVAGVVGVRQALDYRGVWRALGVVLIGWLAQWLIVGIVLAVVGRPAW
jgi:hypothetical protein